MGEGGAGQRDTRMYPWGNEAADCSRLNYDWSATRSAWATPAGWGLSHRRQPLWRAGHDRQRVGVGQRLVSERLLQHSPASNPPGPPSGDVEGAARRQLGQLLGQRPRREPLQQLPGRFATTTSAFGVRFRQERELLGFWFWASGGSLRGAKRPPQIAARRILGAG